MIIPNLLVYVTTHHKALGELYNRIGVRLDDYKTIVLPLDKTVTQLKKDLEGAKTQKEFATVTDILLSHIFKTNFKDGNLASGGIVISAKSKICKISASKNGSFDLLTGENLEHVAKCEFVKDVSPALNIRSDGERPISVVKFVSGEISPVGKNMDNTIKGSAELNELNSIPIPGGSDEDLDTICEEKRKNFESLCSKGESAFIETIAGLLEYLNKNNLEEYTEVKCIVANLLSYDAQGTYITLIQPHGRGSFIPNVILKEWQYSILHSDNYLAVFDDFVSKNCCRCDESARKKIVEKERAETSSPTVMTGANLQDVYKEQVPLIFGENFCLDWKQKLWADELLFKSAMGCDACDLAHHYTGDDYSSQIAFGDWSYIQKCVDSGVLDPESVKGGKSACAFIRSEYFFKCCLVNDPEKHREAVMGHQNSMSARMRAFCMINA